MSKDIGRQQLTVSPTLVRRFNERRVIDALARRGEASRAELTRLTGISAPTISKAIGSLQRLGLVEQRQVHTHGQGAGRPAMHYALARDMVHVIGVTLGADRCLIRTAGINCRDDAGPVEHWPTPRTREALLRSIADRVLATDGTNGKRLLGVGVTVPGSVDASTGTVLASTALPQLDGVALAHELSGRVGSVVHVAAQVTGLCLAEQWFDPTRQYDRTVVIDLTEDLSLRCCTAGQPMTSPAGGNGSLGRLPAAPVGGVAFDPALRLADLATDRAFAVGVSRIAGKPLSPDEAAGLVAEAGPGPGAPQADLHAALSRTLDQLAHVVAVVTHLLSPQAIFLFGRLLGAAPDALDRITQRAAAWCDPPPLHRAAAGLEHAPVAVIIDHLACASKP